MPDDIDQLITEFRSRGSAASLAWKLSILMDLERVPDDRIVPFLVEVLVDRRQPTEVRTHLLKRIRNGGVRPAQNGPVAAALISLLGETANANIRTQTVLALCALIDVDGVLAVLGRIALDESAPLDLRYTAFTTVERAGPDVVLAITDDGSGFDQAAARSRRGLGLLSLDERARLVGGRLTIDTKPQRGTELRVVVPIIEAKDAARDRIAG